MNVLTVALAATLSLVDIPEDSVVRRNLRKTATTDAGLMELCADTKWKTGS